MEVISTILSFIFLAFLLFYISALIKPKQRAFVKQFGEGVTRKKISKVFLPILAVLFVLPGVTAPQNTNQSRLEAERNNQAQQAEVKSETVETEPVVEEKTVTEKQVVDFTTETRYDSTAPNGQTKTIREGTAGEKTLTYKVTYTDGVETNRELVSESVTAQPVSKVVSIGTYTAPKTQGDGYTNSDGNHVRSPSSDPAGATARCRDGTYSYSQNRRGTCSHHGGVAEWL